MLGNLKIFTIALLMRVVMRRTFNVIQWEALFLLVAGACTWGGEGGQSGRTVRRRALEHLIAGVRLAADRRGFCLSPLACSTRKLQAWHATGYPPGQPQGPHWRCFPFLPHHLHESLGPSNSRHPHPITHTAGITVNQIQNCAGGANPDASAPLIPAILCTLGTVTVPAAASVYNEFALKKHMDTSVHLQVG